MLWFVRSHLHRMQVEGCICSQQTEHSTQIQLQLGTHHIQAYLSSTTKPNFKAINKITELYCYSGEQSLLTYPENSTQSQN